MKKRYTICELPEILQLNEYSRTVTPQIRQVANKIYNKQHQTM